MAGPIHPFAVAAAHAVAEALELDPELFQVTAPPKPELGDFAVGCFPAARARKQAPPVIAKQVAEAFEPTELLERAQAVGPFVNFHARRSALYKHLFDNAAQPIPQSIGAGKTICVDYSSPNIAKHLAYHHIRSTVIGHALVNTYRALGYRVIGINHLGDWGTTHGMLLAAREMWGAPNPLTIDALNNLYVRFRAAMKDDPSLEVRGRAWFKRLEDGEPEARTAWNEFREVSLTEFQEVYDLLGIKFDEVKGESEYEAAMPGVIQELTDKGLACESDGALVVLVAKDEKDNTPPLILRKSDGATMYATRDLAAAQYRWNNYQFEKSLYVVDRGQGLHFRQLFTTLAKAGYSWSERCAHVPFGLVRLGGKKTGTRTGNVVLLREVLQEAADGVAPKIRENNEELTSEQLSELAGMVGIGGVVFANLVSQRDKDVDFAWEDILRLDGDSGPYCQYSHARCCSLARKAGVETIDMTADPAPLTHAQEWALALKLCELPDIVRRASETDEPHGICRYLLEVCTEFSRWFTTGNQDKSLRVVTDDEATTRARLALVGATQSVLRVGLGILGIAAPTRM